MPSDWGNDPDSVLRGLFGNLQSAAESGTTDVAGAWSALQDAAGTWATGVLSVTEQGPITPEMVIGKAGELLAGITIQDVDRYMAAASESVAAKAELHALDPGAQITGTAIFTPPWSTTADNPAVPNRYRIRVLRDITVRGFTLINRQEWATYEITSPLTSVSDALNQANTLFSQASYNSRASINEVLDYSIEQV